MVASLQTRFFVNLVLLLSILTNFSVADVKRSDGSNCSCGFSDSSTGNVFTESIIVFFNETKTLPVPGFDAENYANKFEKCWNCKYRNGANINNLEFVQDSDNTSYLNFLLDPSDSQHLVVGGGLRTIRRDIQFGSFRSYMRSPPPNRRNFQHWGSAMTMLMKFNDTQSIEMSVMNTNDPATGWVGTFVNSEFTDRSLGTNFTILGNASEEIGITSPYDFVPYKVDWTDKGVNFTIGTNITRKITKEGYNDMPISPSPLFLRHWSLGNKFSTEGPPGTRVNASIAFVRLFFNSSAWTLDAHKDFDSRCTVADTCSMDDMELRGATPYNAESLLDWKEPDARWKARIPAIIIGCIAIGISTILIFFTAILRIPWGRMFGKEQKVEEPNQISIHQPHRTFSDGDIDSGRATPYFGNGAGSSASSFRGTSARNSLSREESEDDMSIRPASPTRRFDSRGTTPRGSTLNLPFDPNTPRHSTMNLDTPRHSAMGLETPRMSALNLDTTRHSTPWSSRSLSIMAPSTVGWDAVSLSGFSDGGRNGRYAMTSEFTAINRNARDANAQIRIGKEANTGKGKGKGKAAGGKAALQPARKRIDYLAGLTAICSIIVTIMHFGLSYVPAMVQPNGAVHFQSERWVQRIVGPIFLNQMWLGVFFTTSTRFLSTKYLKEGNLKHVAQTCVRRIPRLMVPVAVVALLEYFLLDAGATHYLEYMPSITWSTWPFVTSYETFGHYISELIELVYLIPNAPPQITNNYCTGVLWTMAVQIEGTWWVLLGIIMAREMKTPWKRICFYWFCVVASWYAVSWGSYFWLGIILTDMDVSYKWKPWLYARPFVFYPFCLFAWCVVAFGVLANTMPTLANGFNFVAAETNLHPDFELAIPTGKTDRAGYPDYFNPRLNGLCFAIGLQTLVEISTTVQKILSFKVFIWLFPHIFTIYLMHGVVFWTWGAWVGITMTDHNVPYAFTIATVGITSYIVLFLCLPIITPILEALGRDVTESLWKSASEKAPPKRPTMFPFPSDLILKRDEMIPPPGSGEFTRTNSLSNEGYETDYEKKTSEENN